VNFWSTVFIHTDQSSQGPFYYHLSESEHIFVDSLLPQLLVTPTGDETVQPEYKSSANIKFITIYCNCRFTTTGQWPHNNVNLAHYHDHLHLNGHFPDEPESPGSPDLHLFRNRTLGDKCPTELLRKGVSTPLRQFSNPSTAAAAAAPTTTTTTTTTTSVQGPFFQDSLGKPAPER